MSAFPFPALRPGQCRTGCGTGVAAGMPAACGCAPPLPVGCGAGCGCGCGCGIGDGPTMGTTGCCIGCTFGFISPVPAAMFTVIVIVVLTPSDRGRLAKGEILYANGADLTPEHLTGNYARLPETSNHREVHDAQEPVQ